MYAAGGLFAYLISVALFATGSVWLVAGASLSRLLLGIAPAARSARRFGGAAPGPLYPLALALPYPVNLALLAYAKRYRWLPFDAARVLSGPTASLIFLTAALLASRWITDAAVGKVTQGRGQELLRRFGHSLFAATAIVVVLAPSPLSLWLLHYVIEPAALVGYAAIIGRASNNAHS